MEEAAAPVIQFRRAAPAIEADGLGRMFKGRVAVEGLSLAVEPGEIFGFLGPNGAGKTTTLRMLATLLAPTAGRASMLGHDILSGAMQVRRNLGVMTERPGLYERLSVDANLRLWAEAHEVEQFERAIASALELTGMADRRHDRVSALSKGLRQRASLARAIVHRPKLLLLDEPSSGLDPAAAVQVEAMVRELVRGGATVFLNTHRLAEAQRLCDRVAILNTRLVALGTPAELQQRIFGAAIVVRLAGQQGGTFEAAVRPIPGVRDVRADGPELRIDLQDPARETPAVVSLLARAGAAIVEVRPAGDLEQAYLDLVGRPRDDESDEEREELAA
jgi:ABC-2 type transport system ATP-binding protein